MIYEIKRVKNSIGQTLRYRVVKTEGTISKERFSMPKDEKYNVRTSRQQMATLAVLSLFKEECLSDTEAAQLIEQIH